MQGIAIVIKSINILIIRNALFCRVRIRFKLDLNISPIYGDSNLDKIIRNIYIIRLGNYD